MFGCSLEISWLHNSHMLRHEADRSSYWWGWQWRSAYSWSCRETSCRLCHDCLISNRRPSSRRIRMCRQWERRWESTEESVCTDDYLSKRLAEWGIWSTVRWMRCVGLTWCTSISMKIVCTSRNEPVARMVVATSVKHTGRCERNKCWNRDFHFENEVEIRFANSRGV